MLSRKHFVERRELLLGRGSCLYELNKIDHEGSKNHRNNNSLQEQNISCQARMYLGKRQGKFNSGKILKPLDSDDKIYCL